jgi:hypothetical protein
MKQWVQKGADSWLPEYQIIGGAVDASPSPMYNRLSKSPLALRYETNAPRHDAGIVHYDISGGRALPSIIKGQPGMEYAQDAEDSLAAAMDMVKSGRVRGSLLDNLRDGRVDVVDRDPFYGSNYERYLSKTYKDRPLIYRNEVEGAPLPGSFTGMPLPKLDDILNDPELRRAWNFSLAVPETSKVQTASEVFRADGGSVESSDSSPDIQAIITAMKAYHNA